MPKCPPCFSKVGNCRTGWSGRHGTTMTTAFLPSMRNGHCLTRLVWTAALISDLFCQDTPSTDLDPLKETIVQALGAAVPEGGVPISPGDIDAILDASQDFSDRLECFVAEQVPVGVVDFFEVIEITHQQTKGMPGVPGVFHGTLDLVVEALSVCNLSEFVGIGRVGQGALFRAERLDFLLRFRCLLGGGCEIHFGADTQLRELGHGHHA